ncbi:TetR family transcriptional regulator [Nocardioides sp. NPDC126508]
MTSLRETKKAQTRQRISDVATQMFATRGFEAVTIAEIAEAAGVSKVTVFNYFPRKEDIFFDRVPEIRSLFGDAIARRGERTPMRALRDLMTDLEQQRHPFLGLDQRYVRFWRTVLDSPALRARARELVDDLSDHLAAQIEASGVADGGADGVAAEGPSARLTAALAVAVVREAFTGAAVRLLAGEPLAEVDAGYRAALVAGFDHLERGIA